MSFLIDSLVHWELLVHVEDVLMLKGAWQVINHLNAGNAVTLLLMLIHYVLVYNALRKVGVLKTIVLLKGNLRRLDLLLMLLVEHGKQLILRNAEASLLGLQVGTCNAVVLLLLNYALPLLCQILLPLLLKRHDDVLFLPLYLL